MCAVCVDVEVLMQGKSPLLESSGASTSDDIDLECYKLSPSKKRYGKQVSKHTLHAYSLQYMQ